MIVFGLLGRFQYTRFNRHKSQLSCNVDHRFLLFNISYKAVSRCTEQICFRD